MAREDFTVEFAIPEGVDVSVEKGVFTVKGEKGEATKDLFHPMIESKVEGDKVVFHVPEGTQREKKLTHTYRSHVKNLFKGVTQGITYRMKVCASHFPMNVDYNNNQLEVKNYIGERTPRTLNVPEGVDIKIDGDELILTGVDKEEVAQTAANIEKLTRRRGFDHRIFQDGIYITEKDGKELI